MMEYQNNNGNYDKRNRRKAKKRKLLFYRVACVTLCLLIVSVIFGVVHFLGESKDPGLLSKENTKTDKNYSWFTDDQNEAVPSVPEPAISDQANKISVNITAANAIVMNKDTNEVLYQKKSTAKIAPASTAKMIMALTALDYCSPEDEMKVGAEIEMIQSDSSTAWLMKGDTRIHILIFALPSENLKK